MASRPKVTDLAEPLETVIEELNPDAFHNTSDTPTMAARAITVDSRHG